MIRESNYVESVKEFNYIEFLKSSYYDESQKLEFLSKYESQYSKNRELCKNDYKNMLHANLKVNELVKSLKYVEKHSDFENFDEHQIYIFLLDLSIYEMEINKQHLNFEISDWEKFRSKSILFKSDEIIFLNKKIFKNNRKTYNWTKAEDEILKKIIIENKSNSRLHKWKKISALFNLEKIISQPRNPSDCKERWETKLKQNFKKGKWSLEEDIKILEFVLRNGFKWVQLSNNIINRTEISLKNRFFHLLSKFLSIPSKEIKKKIDYSNKNLIEQALKHFCEWSNEEMKNNFQKLDLNQISDEEIINLLTNSDEFTLHFHEFLDN